MSVETTGYTYTPLEAPSSAADRAPYLEFWPRQTELYPSSEGGERLGRLAAYGAVYMQDPDMAGDYVPLGIAAGAEPADVVKSWQWSLGPFNHLEHGKEDLLRGAAAIFEDNTYDSNHTFVPLAGQSGEDVTTDFLERASKLRRMNMQVPSVNLLRAGELVHTAALIEDDIDTKDALLGVASKAYGRLLRKHAQWDELRHSAAQYLGDINFHLLSNRIRQANEQGKSTRPLHDDAMALLDKEVGNFLEYVGSKDCRLDTRARSGLMFEDFTKIVVRKMVYSEVEIPGGHQEIRSAFSHEDRAYLPKGLGENWRFDAVLQNVDSTGSVRVAKPWQMKLGNGIAACAEPYHPGIEVVTGEDITIGTMVEAGRSLHRAIQDGNLRRLRGPLRHIQETIEPHLEPAAAA